MVNGNALAGSGQASALLNEVQAAKFLNCSAALLRKWRRAGCSPHYVRVGKLVRYCLDDLKSWVAIHRIHHIG